MKVSLPPLTSLTLICDLIFHAHNSHFSKFMYSICFNGGNLVSAS